VGGGGARYGVAIRALVCLPVPVGFAASYSCSFPFLASEGGVRPRLGGAGMAGAGPGRRRRERSGDVGAGRDAWPTLCSRARTPRLVLTALRPRLYALNTLDFGAAGIAAMVSPSRGRRRENELAVMAESANGARAGPRGALDRDRAGGRLRRTPRQRLASTRPALWSSRPGVGLPRPEPGGDGVDRPLFAPRSSTNSGYSFAAVSLVLQSSRSPRGQARRALLLLRGAWTRARAGRRPIVVAGVALILGVLVLQKFMSVSRKGEGGRSCKYFLNAPAGLAGRTSPASSSSRAQPPGPPPGLRRRLAERCGRPSRACDSASLPPVRFDGGQRARRRTGAVLAGFVVVGPALGLTRPAFLLAARLLSAGRRPPPPRPHEPWARARCQGPRVCRPLSWGGVPALIRVPARR